MKKNAFTLLEVIIAVALLILLTSFGTLSIRSRIKKNEYFRIKSQIPSMIETASFKSYELGTSGTMNVSSKSVSVSVASSNVNYEVKSSIYTFSTSPAGISPISINDMGAFESTEDFDILLSDNGTNKLVFDIKSNPDLGIYSLELKEH